MLLENTYVCSKEDSNIENNNIVKDWMLNYVGEPNENINRAGAICPFIKKAHNTGSIYFVQYDAKNQDFEEYRSRVFELISFYKDKELELPPEKKDLFSIIVIINNLSEENFPKFIDELHYSCRLNFMNEGLMLGEFHPHSRKPSARNENFNPLISPVPCFALRKITSHDILFINRDGDALEKRKEELNLYIEKNCFVGKKADAFYKKIKELV
ncbi:hypothetical protein RUK98_003280 [Vibrio cholerae]|nr:hypothetical protein [Vibrio cholerae]